MSSSKQNILIIGSGWAGSTLATSLDENKFSITVVSPESTTPYTPLLASAACGLYDYSLVETPIRHTGKRMKYIKARVLDIDFKGKNVKCQSVFEDAPTNEFVIDYDIVVVAPGCVNQTFNTPGVAENALFLRNVKDAMKVSSQVQNCFEKASIPGLTEQQQRSLLHFVVVGAGPTGVEVSSELSDLFADTYSKLYPHLNGKVSITIHDIAENVLSGFDSKLQEYAMSSFDKRNVEVLTGSHIEKVEKACLFTKEKGRIECGVVIWATGNKCSPLVETLPVKKTPRNPRILTDDFLRIYTPSSTLIDSAYALGDAADVEDARLPTTAEVACQKASYLAKSLNRGFEKPFRYEQAALVAYLGQNDGVISGKKDYSGAQAWIAWRSKNFLWTRTWRQKVLIVVGWLLDLVTGRAIAPR
ncbi:FAD/NAD(P)-binding domain-containing protein [Mollisia scopiformis]|uniref:FAD/NAD(P)-binding domain-containing protein n=1 Tax=Mollisia scopiformis TaxID=149040 RepID=A0A194WXW4_MOLSC|nr:FAD/NAD(P)-binding domain-containing protein [Mollisia scopiformis]KUJ12770.1 FAD/NAD(P)-binding domain-containing protein [Mollisia scopiformis]